MLPDYCIGCHQSYVVVPQGTNDKFCQYCEDKLLLHYPRVKKMDDLCRVCETCEEEFICPTRRWTIDGFDFCCHKCLEEYEEETYPEDNDYGDSTDIDAEDDYYDDENSQIEDDEDYEDSTLDD